mgnify:CR=1 FL=1
MNDAARPGPFHDPALRPVVELVAQRLEQRRLLPTGRVNVTGLDREGRTALGQLVGQHLTRDRIQLDLAELDSIARDRLASSDGLVGVCEDVLGRRLVDRALVREQTRQVREDHEAVQPNEQLIDLPLPIGQDVSPSWSRARRDRSRGQNHPFDREFWLRRLREWCESAWSEIILQLLDCASKWKTRWGKL